MKEKIITMRLVMNTANGDFCISFNEAKIRTKRMISYDKGVAISDISLFDNLNVDLMYSDRDKMDLKPLIDQVFFSDVNANAIPSELVNAITVRDLAGMIYGQFVPKQNRC